MRPPPGQLPLPLWGDDDDAARAVGAGRLRRRVLWYVAGRLEGATCDEAEAALDLRHQTCSALIRELVLLDCLVDSRVRRRTRSGRRAVVWCLTALGRRAYRATVAGPAGGAGGEGAP